MAHSVPSSHALHPYADEHADRGPALVAGSIILIVVASIAVVLRLLARRLKKLAWAADDYFVVVALLFAYGMFVSLLYCP